MSPLNKVNQSQINKIYDNGSKKESSNLSNSFGKVFQEVSVQFSKHANMRLDTRNINLSNEQINRLEKGIENAEQKGIKDSLIMVDNIAFVVNIANRTVVTAVEQPPTASIVNKQKVFTNIDGAVIV
ncbi:MAG: hypothetical protein FWF50_00810 [Defluviitaleaceae bacterium]|nr:hypothetical protein [Defluviitaleaceae bacterium]